MKEALQLDLTEVSGTLEHDLRVLAGLLASGKCADRVCMGPDKRLSAVVWDPKDDPRKDIIIHGERYWPTPGIVSLVLTYARGEPLFMVHVREPGSASRKTRGAFYVCWSNRVLMRSVSHPDAVMHYDPACGLTITYEGETATFCEQEINGMIENGRPFRSG